MATKHLGSFNASVAALGGYSKGVSRIDDGGYIYTLNTDAVLQAARGNTDTVDQTVLPSAGDGSSSADWIAASIVKPDYEAAESDAAGILNKPEINQTHMPESANAESGVAFDLQRETVAESTLPHDIDATGATDVSAILQADLDKAIPSLWPAGIYRVESQLFVDAIKRLIMDPQCVILRAWVGGLGNFVDNATFRNRNVISVGSAGIVGGVIPTTTDDDIYISGGRIRALDETMIGTAYCMFGCNNLILDGTVVERSVQAWAYAIGGNDFQLKDVGLIENQLVFEDGVHVLYSETGGVISLAPNFQSGDDTLAFGSNYNYPVNAITAYAPSTKSLRGHFVRIIQNREGITNSYAASTEKVQNITVNGGVNYAGQLKNGLIRSDSGGYDASNAIRPEEAGLFENITIANARIIGPRQNPIETGHTLGVKLQQIEGLFLDKVCIEGCAREAIHIVDCTGTLRDCEGMYPAATGLSESSLLVEDSDIVVSGGSYESEDLSAITVRGDSYVSLFNNVKCKLNLTNTAACALYDNAELNADSMEVSGDPSFEALTGIRALSANVVVTARDIVLREDNMNPIYITDYKKIRAYGRSTEELRYIISGTIFVAETCRQVRVVNEVAGATDSLYFAKVVNGYVSPYERVEFINGNPTEQLAFRVGTAVDGFQIGSDTFIAAGDSLSLKRIGDHWELY